jgi:hypothetical protein
MSRCDKVSLVTIRYISNGPTPSKMQSAVTDPERRLSKVLQYYIVFACAAAISFCIDS